MTFSRELNHILFKFQAKMSCYELYKSKTRLSYHRKVQSRSMIDIPFTSSQFNTVL